MLNPYHLKYFCDACQTGSLIKAAALNRVSHSAISQAIKSMENILEVKLLQHGKRRFELTEKGSSLFRQSYELFNQFEKVINSVNEGDVEVRGPLRLGVSHSIAQGLINSKWIQFYEKNPKLDSKFFVGNSISLENLLDSRIIDVGFGIEDGSFVKFERQVLHTGKFVLVSAKKCSQKNNFLVGDKGSEVQALRIALKKYSKIARFTEIQSWSILMQFAEAGLGVALIPDFLLKNNLKVIKIYKEIKLPEYQLCAFYRSYESLSFAAKAFLKQVNLE